MKTTAEQRCHEARMDLHLGPSLHERRCSAMPVSSASSDERVEATIA
jgi:hypothetical protein